MVYFLLKIYGRLAIKIFCKKIIINKPDFLRDDGPLLLAANHPNSFLDGVILTILFNRPIYALARGDAFNNKRVATILKWLNQLPVYRTSEGAANLAHNYLTFSACHQKFKEAKMVLIFSEACCVNEWHLRPLRKGTARLAISSWEQNIPLKVLPVGLNYNSFKEFGKEVHIHFGTIIEKNAIRFDDSSGKQLNDFNDILQMQLQPLVYEAENAEAAKKFFPAEGNLAKTVLLFIPALVGVGVHWPLFYLSKALAQLKFRNSDHYDSVLVVLLFILYPWYLLLIALLLCPHIGLPAFSVFIVLPFTAWSWVQIKG